VRIKAIQYFRANWAWLSILLVALFLGGRLLDAWRWNSRALLFVKGKEGPIIPARVSGCSHIWLAAAEAGRREDLSAQREIWKRALGCSPQNLYVLQPILPQDKEMALLATQIYPASADAWFWLGEALAPGDRLAARQAYLRTVTLSAHHSWAWCRLGYDFEQDGELETALDDFLNCCYSGDPGSNGCYGAGRMMERLGNLQQAIAYYRLSRWEGSLKRADELEKQLIP